MAVVLGAGSPIVFAAAVGSAWGFVDALTRPDSLFQAVHVSKWGLVAAFGALTVLIVSSGIGFDVIHAPYLLKTLNALLFMATSVSALAWASSYVWILTR